MLTDKKISAMASYTPDILSGFEQYQFEAQPDFEGRVVFTLVRKLCTNPSSKAVLYIHGFNDYFFQDELAANFNEQGYNFYAIDIRKSGRSILPHQTAFDMRSIDENFADFDTAIAQIKQEGSCTLTILAHSMGGLIASCYLHHKGQNTPCSALILNSPFLEMNKSWLARKLGIPFVSAVAKFIPRLKIGSTFSPFYGESLHQTKRGEWDYNLSWKPLACKEVRAGWIRAIHKGHKAVKRGLNIQCPVLVMSSDKSLKGRTWSDSFLTCDLVLNVKHIQHYADRLGKNISKLTIADGLHDLFLSQKLVRTSAYKKLFSWLNSINL